MDRRTALKTGVAGAIVLGARSVCAEGLDISELPPRTRAIGAGRVINTYENAFCWRNDGTSQYLTFTDLAQNEELRAFLQDNPFVDIDAAARGGELIPGFSAELALLDGGTNYTLLLVHKDSKFALQTDASGVLHEGVMEAAGSAQIAFVGAPMALPQRLTTGNQSRLRNFAAWLLERVFPSVAACCSGICDGFCTGTACRANCPSPAKCCNIGYAECTWCCTTANNCACVFTYC